MSIKRSASRRKLISLTALSITTLLAGCGSNANQQTPTQSDTPTSTQESTSTASPGQTISVDSGTLPYRQSHEISPGSYIALKLTTEEAIAFEFSSEESNYDLFCFRQEQFPDYQSAVTGGESTLGVEFVEDYSDPDTGGGSDETISDLSTPYYLVIDHTEIKGEGKRGVEPGPIADKIVINSEIKRR